VQYKAKDGWEDLPEQQRDPMKPIANGRNRVTFPVIDTTALRIVFQGSKAPANLQLIEVEAFGPDN
jgi:hypothetical protein